MSRLRDIRTGWQSDYKVDIESFFCDLRGTIANGITEEKLETLNTFAAKCFEIIEDRIQIERSQAKLYGTDAEELIELLETIKDCIESERWNLETRIEHENTYR